MCPDSCTMSGSSREMGASLTQEILRHLGLASKTAAWGTLGTLRTVLSFSVDKDVQRLLRAIAGQSVDHGAILDVLTNQSREQRQLISRTFQERTQQDLLTTLRAALSGAPECVVVACCSLPQPAAQSDARELRQSLQDSRFPEDVALEILATRSAPQLQECLVAYQHDFQVGAEEDIKAETSGTLQDLLLALAKDRRESYSGIIDYNLAEQDVQVSWAEACPALPRLPAARPALALGGVPSGRRGWRTAQPGLTRLDPWTLRMLHGYRQRWGRELETGIRSRFHGAARGAARPSAPLYFADKLHAALQEPEPNYQVLTRILISRRETDLLSEHPRRLQEEIREVPVLLPPGLKTSEAAPSCPDDQWGRNRRRPAAPRAPSTGQTALVSPGRDSGAFKPISLVSVLSPP
ncbi:Annexin A9 [Galemys pyrenaicus]|uniref:Annexin A9 n=1 Tax=Galemys pyrenaicus TaxID=202257 RepID=A0A8J6A1Z8_GALPY|nr:Annexin A9 [Galemys pyrenaicus]